MAKTVTLEQVKAAFIKDLYKGFAKLTQRIKKSKNVEDLQDIMAIYVDDFLTQRTTDMAVKFEDQENC